MLPNMPKVDRNWTWAAWADAQRATDPWKVPFLRNEVAVAVLRGNALGLSDWEMECLLQIPAREIYSMRSGSEKPDPIRDEIRELVTLLETEQMIAEVARRSLSEQCPVGMRRFEELYWGTCSLLKDGIIDVADPETGAKML